VLAGRYRVLRRLGAGGMGTVYLAEHVHLGRLTAVKVLCPPLCADDPDAEQRFRQEALLVAKVRHPSVAQVYDFDRLPDGRYLLAMEYVPGDTVAQQLERDGPFPVPQAIRVLHTVADALNHVHWIGILHGDLKPQNIMLGPGGEVKLLDFGVAHEMAQLAAPDAFQPGTLAYMSPEQLLGDARGRERHLCFGRRVLRDAHGPTPPRGDHRRRATDPAAAASTRPGELAPPGRVSRIGGGGGAGASSRPSGTVAVGAGLRAGGGTGRHER